MSACCYMFSSEFRALFAKSIIFIDRGSLYPAVSSAIWFSGAFPEEVLRQRVEESLAANLWFGGSVQKDPATAETALSGSRESLSLVSFSRSCNGKMSKFRQRMPRIPRRSSRMLAGRVPCSPTIKRSRCCELCSNPTTMPQRSNLNLEDSMD